MSDARAAYDPNRLPWLSDAAPVRRRRSPAGWRPVVLWSLLALILVAAGGYWVGMRSVDQIESDATNEVAARDRAVADPQPRPEQQEAPPQVQPAPVAELTPIAPPPLARMAQPEARAPTQRYERSSGADEPVVLEEPAPAPVEEQAATPEATAIEIAQAPIAQPQFTAPPARVAQKPAPLRPWPADVSSGAAGRVVRIGTFSSRLGAKRAWARIIRTYPGMRRLKAVVVAAPSLRNGRTYYRLQFGTTSQAHSAVLCQRMRIVGQSCVIVGI